MIEDECSPYTQFVISALRSMAYAPGGDDAHMDAEDLLDGVQAVLYAAMGRDTGLLDAEQPDDPALDPFIEHDTSNAEYPDFFHRLDGTRCPQCVSLVKRMNSITMDLADLDSLPETLPATDRRVLAHSLIGSVARQPNVEAAAREALLVALRIYHTEAKRRDLPDRLRHAVERADDLHGPQAHAHRIYGMRRPHPLHSFLDEHKGLSAQLLGASSEQRRGQRVCGSPRTRSGEPCQNRVADGTARCAAGHFIT